MTLLLNGQKINGKSLTVTASLRMESDDLSGQTSNTEIAHKGFKPKTLSVNLLIPYKDRAWLSELMRLAQATQPSGQRAVYRVVNDTAQAFGVRQAQFDDNVSAKEDGGISAWQVQFSLSEILSSPERVESRRPEARQEQSEVQADGAGHTGLQAVLERLERYLAPAP